LYATGAFFAGACGYSSQPDLMKNGPDGKRSASPQSILTHARKQPGSMKPIAAAARPPFQPALICF